MVHQRHRHPGEDITHGTALTIGRQRVEVCAPCSEAKARLSDVVNEADVYADRHARRFLKISLAPSTTSFSARAADFICCSPMI